MNGDSEINLDPFIQSLDKRGYALNLDAKRNVLQIVGKPGLKDPLTDDDFTFLRQNKSALMSKFIKAEDQPVTEPLESQLLSTLPGAALGTAGAALGETAAAKLGGGALMRGAGRLLGATGGNLAAENLPKELGGAESPSLKRAALYGGVQEAALAPFSLLSKKAVGAGEQAVGKQTETLAKQLEMQKRPFDVKQALGQGEIVPDTSGLAGDPARQAYLRAAQGYRGQYGVPLGEAYENLKLAGDSPRIDSAIDELTSSLVSPIKGKTTSLLEEGKTFGVAKQAPKEERVVTPFGAEATQPPEAEGKIPSLDEMRDWRQRVSKELANAKGGDRFALRRALEIADDALEPHLPDDVAALRRAYRGVMRVVPYEVDTGIGPAVNPAEVASRVFETPERAKGILQHIDTPEDKAALEDALSQHILSKVNPEAKPEEQLKQMQRALWPLQKSGVTKDIYGTKRADKIRDALDINKNLYAKQTNFADPKWREQFENSFQAYIRSPEGQELSKQVYAGYDVLRDGVAATQEGAQRLAQAPTFRAARERGIEEHLSGGTMALPDWIKHRAMHHLVWAALGGGAGKALGEPLIMGTLASAAATGAWDTVMRAGAAPYLASFLASDGARAAGRNMARLLAALGTQGGRVSEAQQPQDVTFPQ